MVTAALGVAPSGGYGGGSWCFAGDEEIVVATPDGALVVVGVDGAVRRTLTRDGRAFAPVVSARGDVACCIERDDACDVAVVPLDGTRWPRRVSDAAWAWDPSWDADGAALAWHEWDAGVMPWDASRIVVQVDGGAPTVIAGGASVSVGQPRFAPIGRRLAYTSDESGFANLWVHDLETGSAHPVLAERSEHAEPSWGPGQRSFAWSPDGEQLAWCRNEKGFGRLVVGAPGRRSARDLSRGWHRGIDWGAGGIVAARSGARTPTQIAVLAPDGSGRRVIARGPVAGFVEDALAEPRSVTWKSGTATVHGLLYPAVGVPVGERPPLLVDVHGGPTGQATVSWNPEVAYWTSRGWAVLRPNPRGSTGYGRTYAQSLSGRWGERDVGDVAAGIRAAHRDGWADGGRVAISGGSSGGFVALLVAARHPELVRAVVDASGVTDLFDLAETTHRFESRYLDRLVGELPGHADRYRDRSPVTHARAITAPVLVLHGTADEVVPIGQADRLVEELRAVGTPVEYEQYDGAGHGLRAVAHVEDAMSRTDAFLTRWVLRR
ncbi:MAG TPA: S9 family peptidase [Acidimicrobiia bacterium]|nr:S9 family peptidase [Acidimicrobiia bacterium]